MAHNNLLPYPNFSEELKIITNDRNLQLGTVIIQNIRPIYFYFRNITDVQ